MMFRFDMGIDDMAEFQKHFMRTSRVMRRQFRASVYIVATVFLLLALTFWFIADMNLSPMTIYWLAVAVLWIVVMPPFIRKKWLKRTMRNLTSQGNRIFYGPCEVTVTDDALLVETAEVTDRLKWGTFIYGHETPDYLFLYISEVSAFVFPKNKVTAEELAPVRRQLEKNDIIIENYSEKNKKLK